MSLTEDTNAHDPFHAAVMDRVAYLDRAFKVAHPDANWFVRPGTPHELCEPGGGCRIVEWVKVWFIEDGMRVRQAVTMNLPEAGPWPH